MMALALVLFLIGIIQLSMELWRGIIRLARAGRPERTHPCRPGWREGEGFYSPAGFGPRDRRLAWGRTMGAKSCSLGRRVGGTDALWLDGSWVLLAGRPSDAEMDSADRRMGRRRK